MSKRFDDAMRLMRRHDSQLQEEGFGIVPAHAAAHLDELLAEFQRNDNEHGLRCWLLELIGEARSPHALPVLIEQLHSEDEALRHWAEKGLEQLDSREARRALYEARTKRNFS
ncbi:HEAT repeat domain-containing protein [Actinomadura sp. 6N118]|uniref:HEAT repeat domain-containing protein n=1 Tax=Actinomadura sp. 6N118 TaxID=3375151 RepID=UPI00379E62C1